MIEDVFEKALKAQGIEGLSCFSALREQHAGLIGSGRRKEAKALLKRAAKLIGDAGDGQYEFVVTDKGIGLAKTV